MVSKGTSEGCRECLCCSSQYWQPMYRLTWVNTGLLFHADQIREMLAPKVNFLRRVWKQCCNRKGFIAAAVAAVVRWALWQVQRLHDGCALRLLSSHCADLQRNACRKRESQHRPNIAVESGKPDKDLARTRGYITSTPSCRPLKTLCSSALEMIYEFSTYRFCSLIT